MEANKKGEKKKEEKKTETRMKQTENEIKKTEPENKGPGLKSKEGIKSPSKENKGAQKKSNSNDSSNSRKAKLEKQEGTKKVFEAKRLYSEVVIVNRMVTKYMQIGFEAPISRKFAPVFCDNKKGVIFLIPGLLGAVEYYKDFIVQLYASAKIPIIAVSHGNHTKPTGIAVASYSQSLLSWIAVHEPNWIQMHNVWGQVHHKLVFINHFIPTAIPLIIMGHSIGADIALRMLKKNSHLSIVRFILILPLLEHIDCCPIALKYIALLSMCRCIVPVVAHTFGFIPEFLQKRLISLILSQRIGGPDCCQEAATNFSNSLCANAVTELFLSSVKTVHDIDYETLDKYQKHISFFYSENDAWVPKIYFDRLSSVLSLSNTQMPWSSVSHNFFMSSDDVKEVVEVIVNELKDNFLNGAIQMISASGKFEYKSGGAY